MKIEIKPTPNFKIDFNRDQATFANFTETVNGFKTGTAIIRMVFALTLLGLYTGRTVYVVVVVGLTVRRAVEWLAAAVLAPTSLMTTSASAWFYP